jgi:hypothetical protein
MGKERRKIGCGKRQFNTAQTAKSKMEDFDHGTVLIRITRQQESADWHAERHGFPMFKHLLIRKATDFCNKLHDSIKSSQAARQSLIGSLSILRHNVFIVNAPASRSTMNFVS